MLPFFSQIYLLTFNFFDFFKFYIFQEWELKHFRQSAPEPPKQAVEETKVTPKKQSSLFEQRTKPKRRVSVT